ncbi:Condensin complex subunit 2 [Camponotus floridanus]|uniref:Condensin complex subunit 2 n=1 Tax=Camponotus floridanus TaxID=104421 RepID=E2ALK2_CAMFO|nr:condensin complex subunit 2 [Camponotus floridanus]XP_011260467.1 condensin complex subunit 2 [Camponotus floridanus]EFN65704.1 Condensin complex subunit 2 [Camponotus floridanus]
MEARKSIVNKRLESVLHQHSPTSSSPLRRKSVSFQNPPSTALSVNDDEAERLARRREIFTSTPLSTTSNTSTNKRHSLGLGFLANIPAPQMAESISQCIKLNAENKINIKNAFSLEMIDFMTYMIKKQDANMSNLQVASTSLDVSTKIYGFRVDSVHTEILKIVGGLDKQAVDNMEQNAGEHREDVEDAEVNMVQKKKRKKAKQKIFSTVESLRGNIEIQKPMSMMIGEGDLQTSDMLYQATLPHHANSGFYLHLYNDVLVDIAENKSNSQNNSDVKYSIPIIDDFSNLEICASYSNFEFLGWSVEDEPEEDSAEETEHNDDNNRFHFDLEASIEPEDDNNPVPEPMNYFDFQQDDNNVQGCYQEAANRRNENILDTRNVQILTTNASEYSFLQPHMNLHWAGPSHWKFRNFVKPSSDIAVSTKVVGACMQAPLRKKRQIELSYNENSDVIDAKFALSQSNKLGAKTAKTEWNTEDLMLPEDVHYDIAQMTKLYLNSRLILKPPSNGKENDNNAVATMDVSDNEKYDYNNPNDTLEYCPDTNNGDDYEEGGRDDCNFEDDALAGQNFIGDNLVAAPKLANKIPITYCLKAKKIDMRQLKKSIWKLCTNDHVDLININEVENTEISVMKESKQFSDIYKMLPKLLTKTNIEALSVPISFISLLHLANEKTLKIDSLPDMSDIIVGAD